jgi:hypothetical protein
MYCPRNPESCSLLPPAPRSAPRGAGAHRRCATTPERRRDQKLRTSAGRHAAAVVDLEPSHKDPFDRMLIAQALVEGVVLLTADALIGRYWGPIRVL